MTDDPVRLLDESDSELLRSLLGAAREEQPRSAALQGTLAAVGIGAATAVSASAASAASAAAVGSVKGASSASTALIVAKWLGIGLLTGVVATTAMYGVSDALSPPSPPPKPVQPPPVPLTPPPRPALNTAPPEPPVASALPEAVPPPPALPSLPPSAETPEDPSSALSAEVAALDGARNALKSGNAPRALAQLEGYERRFPDARMLPEALFIRMEAFTLKGDKTGALVVAERIVRLYPSSPHAARARALLAAAK